MKILIWMSLFFSKCALAVEPDLNKFQGLWNEVYSLPQRFQKGCFNVTAEYTLKDNKSIKVVNTCRNQESVVTKTVTGEAVIKDLSKGYLKVYFFRPFGLNIFGGDYYVLALDPNYQWAIVGTPDNKYGWVLSRTVPLSNENLNLIKAELQQLGFDFLKFNKTSTK